VRNVRVVSHRAARLGSGVRAVTVTCFVDESAEDGSAFDPFAAQVNGGTVGPWGLQLQRPMRTATVVVAGVFAECSA
jgi:hypothetical protein